MQYGSDVDDAMFARVEDELSDGGQAVPDWVNDL